MRALLHGAMLWAVLCTASLAQSFDTAAKQAILLDHSTGTVLFAKDADEPIPPASLAKLMTMEVVFDRLRSGRLELDDVFTVSDDAWRRGGIASGGSTMFLEPRSKVTVEDLIRGVIIQSGNDAAITLAENIAGTEATFAAMMNERAEAIGLENSTFRNATGLPDDEQRVTLRDMVALARHLYTTYPEFYPIYSERTFKWNRQEQRNRNPLLDDDVGADGLKTGYTEESGYALVASAEADGQRLFLGMSGLDTSRDRARQALAMLRWGQRAFERQRLFEPGAPVADVRVYGGEKNSVSVTANSPIDIFLPPAGRAEMKAEVVYDGPIPAPVKVGQRIGSLRVTRGDQVTQETPLVAAEDVDVGPIHLRALDAAQEALVFWR